MSQIHFANSTWMRSGIVDFRRRMSLAGTHLLILLAVLNRTSTGTPFSPGNLVVTYQGSIREYTLNGILVQRQGIPYPGGAFCPGCEKERDVSIASNGHAFVFNGTFDPYLSEYDALANSWSHRTVAGLSIINNLAYGGLTTTDQFVFTPDHETAGDGDSPQGIVRFDRSGGPTVRFAEGIEPLDLNIGLDGLLYALHPIGSPGGTKIDVYNPTSLAYIRSLDIGRTFNRGIAVDFDGSIFVVSDNSAVYHFSPSGALLNSLGLSTGNTFDIDLAPDGKIAIGGRNAVVTVTNRSFSSAITFDLGIDSVFVSFVPVPEPSTALLTFAIAAFLAALAARRRPHNRNQASNGRAD
jgi:hypothetical protein